MSHSSFEHLRDAPVESLKITLQEYRHRGTGARHLHLSAPDRNNAFLVAFLTVPQDSTGVAHILEHTSLCGSERFAVRDPFFMMSRRSLNTFMNAFTASDWTAYPFASQNRRDFDNLLQVYLDAAFFPRLDPLDFAQEGHRIEPLDPQDPDSELVYKGVVFNEMKGAMSAPVSRLWHTLQAHLFPSTTYHHNSGGEPEHIPELSYEQLKAFHATHYHPSNALLMTYGDIPAPEHHQRFEQWALDRFKRRELDLAVPDERRYDAPRQVEARYAADPEQPLERRTHIVFGWLLGHSFEPRRALEAHLLSGVLLDNSASPLRHLLESTALASAPSELCGLDDSTREASFVCGVEGSEPEHAPALEEQVLEVIREVAENGVEQELVESVLHQLELSQREIRGGHFPYGLRLMVNVLSPALHGGDPLHTLDIDPVLGELREAIQDPGFIRRLARELLLDNPHRVRVVMSPDTGLAARQSAEEAARLAQVQAGMSAQQRRELVERARRLQERQQAQDDPDRLPKVGLADVPPELDIVRGEAAPVAGAPATWYGQGTNGLVYTQVVAELPALSEEQLELLPWLCECMTEVGCADKDYRQAQAWQAAVTGGISADTSVRGAVDDLGRARGLFVLAGKALVRNQEPLAHVLREVYQRARFDEPSRLRELVAQARAQREMAVTGHGHVLAMTAASAGMGPVGALAHRWDGLLGLRRTKELERSLDDAQGLERFARGLADLRDTLAGAAHQFLVVCEPGEREAVAAGLQARWSDLHPNGQSRGALALASERTRVLEGWATSTQVSFCAKAFPAVPVEHADAPVLVVLGQLLTNGFLHRAIREQGGAYGAGASYDSDTGALRFYSYRDPRLAETLADFDRSVSWLLESTHTDRELEEAVLGVIGAIDRPESPAGEAVKAFFGELHGRSAEQRRRFRQRILDVTLDDLRRVAERYLAPEQASIAVISHRGALEGAADALGLTLEVL